MLAHLEVSTMSSHNVIVFNAACQVKRLGSLFRLFGLHHYVVRKLGIMEENSLFQEMSYSELVQMKPQS